MDVFIFLLGGVHFFLSLSLASAQVGSDVDISVVGELLEGRHVRALANGAAFRGVEAEEHVLEAAELAQVGGDDGAVKLVDEHLHSVIN